MQRQKDFQNIQGKKNENTYSLRKYEAQIIFLSCTLQYNVKIKVPVNNEIDIGRKHYNALCINISFIIEIFLKFTKLIRKSH